MKNKFKKRKLQYSHTRWGDSIKVEMRDQNRNIIYKNKFNITDKKAILAFLGVLETYSGFTIAELLNEKLKVGEWW